MLTLKIVTKRNDGLTVYASENSNGTLNVTLKKDDGRIVESDVILKSMFFQWVETRKDW